MLNLKILKMKNLQNYGVQELSAKEIRKTEGGWILWAIGFVGAMINDAQNNPGDFWAGYNATAPK